MTFSYGTVIRDDDDYGQMNSLALSVSLSFPLFSVRRFQTFRAIATKPMKFSNGNTAHRYTEQQDENWNGNENENDNKLNIFIFITIFGHNLTHLPYSRRRLRSKRVCSGFVCAVFFYYVFSREKKREKIQHENWRHIKRKRKSQQRNVISQRLTTTDKR